MSTQSSKKILIVKDDPSNLKLFSDILRLDGYQVIEHKEVEHLLSLARHHRPHLIILEIQQLECPNFNIAHQLKKDPDLKTIPLIAVSPIALPPQEAKAHEVGFDQYLSKPFSITTFLNAVDSVFKQQLNS